MSDITWIIDRITGALIVEGIDPKEAPALVGDLLPAPREIGCALPVAMLPPPAVAREEIASSARVRIAGYYHNSLVEGPGRRSTAKLQGCPIHCRGCITPDSWSPLAGAEVPVDLLAAALLDPRYERDGITVAGGEPFSQPQGLWALIQALRARGCRHILVYSGYTYECLRRMASRETAIGAILGDVNLLIDGPFVAALADRGGAWTGSGNQRIVDLAATSKAGRILCWDESQRNALEAETQK